MRRDVTAGLVLIAGGLLYAWYAYSSLPIGTIRRMGPGMLPMALGVILAGLGLAVAIPGLWRDERIPRFSPRALIMVLAAVVAFALLIRPLGLAAAVLAATVIGSLAQPGFRAVRVAVLSVALIGMAWFLFIFLLGLPIPLYDWRL